MGDGGGYGVVRGVIGGSKSGEKGVIRVKGCRRVVRGMVRRAVRGVVVTDMHTVEMTIQAGRISRGSSKPPVTCSTHDVR